MGEIFMDKWGSDVVTGDSPAVKPPIALFRNANAACKMLNKHIVRGSKIAVHCDVDTDGIGAGYITQSMLRELQALSNTTFIINKDKIHGIQPKHADYFNNTDMALIVILDSSSNETEIIKEFNCDVLVIDHHELDDYTAKNLTGDTAHGKYVIVNNVAVTNTPDYEADLKETGEDIFTPDTRLSGALVTYELFRLYCKVYGLANLPEQLRLNQWAAVTLFSDAIPLLTERNQWYIEQMVSTKELEPTLSILVAQLNKYKMMLDKNFVNFSLSPIINAAVRGGGGLQALDIILRNPSAIRELDKYRQIQRDVLAFKDDDVQELDGFVAKELNGTNINQNYAGVIATKLAGERGVCAIVYTTDNGISSGSFRGTQQIDYRAYFGSFGPDVYAKGHKPAFGFKVETAKLFTIMQGIKDLTLKESRLYITAGDMPEYLQGVYHIKNFDNFRKLRYLLRLAVGNSRVSTDEAINIVAYTTDIELIEEVGKLYKYRVMGLTCKSFEPITKSLVSIYAEFSTSVELYVRNINNWGLN